jgi:hypothetical protein
MSYLARLKALITEKHLPDELTETDKSPSVSFVSDPGVAFSKNIKDNVMPPLSHVASEKPLPDELTEPTKGQPSEVAGATAGANSASTMSYLDRLKALIAEKHLPDELTKLTKTPSVSFVSDRGRAFSQNIAHSTVDWEERAAHLEYDAGVPRSWAEPFARLLCSDPPGDFDPVRWRRVVDAGLIFADKWAADAYRLGWTADDVFGLHPVAPAARHDCKGIAWLLDRGRVVAIDVAGADIVTAQGSKQRFYRNVI